MRLQNNAILRRLRFVVLTGAVSMLAACAHPIMINPNATPQRAAGEQGSDKIVGYVLSDADRAMEVTTAGGGGDRVRYFPYRDLEKGLRDTLKAVYSDVFALKSTSDLEALKKDRISLVFSPRIVTTSSSSSALTWPPTQFSVELTCTVTDPSGQPQPEIRAYGQGNAEFSEFKNDFGLAARRAAQAAFENLASQLKAREGLR